MDVSVAYHIYGPDAHIETLCTTTSIVSAGDVVQTLVTFGIDEWVKESQG